MLYDNGAEEFMVKTRPLMAMMISMYDGEKGWVPRLTIFEMLLLIMVDLCISA